MVIYQGRPVLECGTQKVARESAVPWLTESDEDRQQDDHNYQECNQQHHAADHASGNGNQQNVPTALLLFFHNHTSLNKSGSWAVL